MPQITYTVPIGGLQDALKEAYAGTDTQGFLVHHCLDETFQDKSQIKAMILEVGTGGVGFARPKTFERFRQFSLEVSTTPTTHTQQPWPCA